LIFNEVILNGDVTRVVPMLKRLAYRFVALTSIRSKYAVECINLLAKLQLTLSEKERVQVLIQAFVNTSDTNVLINLKCRITLFFSQGKLEKNKPADMQQENNIRMVKSIFKGMGAGKTDAALIRASKAASAVSTMSTDFQKTFDISQPSGKFEKHEKNSDDDKSLVRKTFKSVCPFKVQAGRTTGCSLHENTLQKIDPAAFKAFVCRNAYRAINLCDLDADV
jgi:hypothetical protein